LYKEIQLNLKGEKRMSSRAVAAIVGNQLKPIKNDLEYIKTQVDSIRDRIDGLAGKIEEIEKALKTAKVAK
jgi:prefoldin subunit 5